VSGQYTRDGETAATWCICSTSPSALRNECLAVNQFSITGPRHTRRPDIVLFVNGLPLVLIELKNPAGRVEGVPADPDLQGTDPRRLPLQRGAGDCWRRPLALQVC
jgi:hypothetical protein